MIGIGVVGCGYWGPNLIRNFTEVTEAKIIACCDKKQDRLNYIKQRYPFLETTTEFNDLLTDEKIDALSIATKVSTHFELAKQGLLHNKHVLIEKPIALNTKDAQELIEISRAKKKVLMVGHTFEYAGAVRKIKELVDNKELGDIYYFETARVNLGLVQGDINVVWDLGVHDISIMLYVLSVEPVSVSAVGEAHLDNGLINTAYISLKFPHKIIGHIHISWLSPVKFRRTTIGGSKKMVVYDDIKAVEKVKIYDHGISVPKDTSSLLERQLIYRTGDVYSPKLVTTEPLKVECAHFIDCIINNKRPLSDGVSGLRVVRILEAIQKSLDSDGESILLNS